MTKRLTALDAFRGLTIALMILVNTPGTWEHVFPPLQHAPWDGWTPTDLVFPFFLFIVGVSMYFSFKKFGHQLDSFTAEKIIKRTLSIFLVGLLLNAFPRHIFGRNDIWQVVFWATLLLWLSMPLWKKKVRFYHVRYAEWACLLVLLGLFLVFVNDTNLRILGVLPRIALAFGAGAFICLSLNDNKKLLVSLAILLIGYWLALIGFGDLTLENNVARTVDLLLLGENHIYGGYGLPFDPEGLLSTLPAIGTVIIGYLSGRIILENEHQKEQAVYQLLFYGFPALFLAYLWNPFFPINKPLWSSSYVLHTGGLAMIILAFCLYFLDVKEQKKWATPFVIFGLNPLFIYALSSLSVKVLIYLIKIPTGNDDTINGYQAFYQNVFVTLAGNNEVASFLFAISYVLLHFVVAWILYKNKIFIKV